MCLHYRLEKYTDNSVLQSQKTGARERRKYTMWGELMRSRWWKGYREIMNRESPTKNSQESVLIERRTHLIWVEVVLAALMLGIKLSRLHFNGDQEDKEWITEIKEDGLFSRVDVMQDLQQSRDQWWCIFHYPTVGRCQKLLWSWSCRVLTLKVKLFLRSGDALRVELSSLLSIIVAA